MSIQTKSYLYRLTGTNTDQRCQYKLNVPIPTKGTNTDQRCQYIRDVPIGTKVYKYRPKVSIQTKCINSDLNGTYTDQSLSIQTKCTHTDSRYIYRPKVSIQTKYTHTD